MATVNQLTPGSSLSRAMMRRSEERNVIATYILQEWQLGSLRSSPDFHTMQITNLQNQLPPEEYSKIQGSVYSQPNAEDIDSLWRWSMEFGVPVNYYEIVW